MSAGSPALSETAHLHLFSDDDQDGAPYHYNSSPK